MIKIKIYLKNKEMNINFNQLILFCIWDYLYKL